MDMAVPGWQLVIRYLMELFLESYGQTQTIVSMINEIREEIRNRFPGEFFLYVRSMDCATWTIEVLQLMTMTERTMMLIW